MYLNLSGAHWWVSDTEGLSVRPSQHPRAVADIPGRVSELSSRQPRGWPAHQPHQPRPNLPPPSIAWGKGPLQRCLVVGFTRDWSMKSHLPWLAWHTEKKHQGRQQESLRVILDNTIFIVTSFWFTGWRWLENIHGKGREWSPSRLYVGWPRGL